MSSNLATAEFVIRNARIYTLDPNKPWVDAVAIRNGQFVATGSFAEIAPLMTTQPGFSISPDASCCLE